MKFTQSILFKIGAVIFAVETLVFAVLGVHYTKRIHGYIDKQIDERISIPGWMISNGTLDIRVATHPGTIETLIGPHFVELMQVWVVDSTGKIVQALDPTRIGEPITEIQDPGRAWTEYRTHQNSLRTIHSPKNHAVICITPIDSTNQTRPARHLFIQVNTERAEKIKTRVVLLAAIGSCIGVLLLSMAMILIFKYLISRRIHSIVSVLHHVEQGDWNARFDGKILKDEIGIIETHVNSMVIQLRETIQTLENRLFDLKESEKERERIQIQFYQAQKMEALGVLTGGVAHDFNNLLTAIQGCTDLALLHTQKNDTVHSDLMEIQLAAKRASDLTHQLLLFSRKQPLKHVLINLNKVIEELHGMMHRLIGEDIVINVPVELDLWTIQADRSCMEQMIINLAVNAKDSMQDGGVLTLRTENVILNEKTCPKVPDALPGRYIRLTVADTGQGIAPDDLEHIFEPFFSTKESGKGTGLGLSVVYGIVEQHGGFIQVSSKVGQGSVFEIYLPAVYEKSDISAEESHPNLDAYRGKGEKILVVEDERGVREFVQTALKRNGYEVHTATTVSEALDLFERNKRDFQLVFSDVVLPDRNGVELVEDLLEKKPDLAVLLSSGYTDLKSQWDIILKKNYHFLQKPYRLNFLLKTIQEVLVLRKD